MRNNEPRLSTHDRPSQELVDEVVRQFVDLLIAGGTSVDMIRSATTRSLLNSVDANLATTFTQLGEIQRDCMEVMCTWRREIKFVDGQGVPLPLRQGIGVGSFDALCKSAGCKNEAQAILKTLFDFGAISIDGDGGIVPETPTFLLGRAHGSGRLAVDGVLKQLKGFLQVVHRNVCSVSGTNKSRFERACTVSVAAELEAIFDTLVRSRGQEFIDSIDEWLERNAKRESVSGRYLELGAGVYFIELGERENSSKKG
ncbi:MAG: DUF6502 family protein [Pyrinomonadaceae bacterium]|nr:DUF6502 family protein [Pyrinomonadaceae bacterium]